METLWRTALWRQFGAAIDMLENALLACPASLWTQRLWRETPSPPLPPEPLCPLPSLPLPGGGVSTGGGSLPPRFGEFWYVSFHALVWLDLYLSGVPEEEFAPPAPFPQEELDSVAALPERRYTKEELRAYLASTRQRCHSTLVALTDDQACRPVAYPWVAGQPISYLELQLYNLRHVQEHAVQLILVLGQHAIPDTDLDWVPRAKDDLGSR